MKIRNIIAIVCLLLFSVSYAQEIRILVGKPIPNFRLKDRAAPGLAVFRIPRCPRLAAKSMIPKITNRIAVVTDISRLLPKSVTLGNDWNGKVRWRWQQTYKKFGPGNCIDDNLNRVHVGSMDGKDLRAGIRVKYYIHRFSKKPIFAYVTRSLNNTSVISDKKTYKFAGCRQDHTHLEALTQQYGFPYNSYLICVYK